MKNTLVFAFILVSLLAAVGLSIWLLHVRPAQLQFRQVGVYMDLKAYADSIHDYQKLHGSYPLELDDATAVIDWFSPIDRWQTPLLYLSDGTFFVLASLGRGGQPDGVNYLAARRELSDEQLRTLSMDCRNLEIDQVVTDTGWYRRCGKP